MRLVRQKDPQESEADGTCHWNSVQHALMKDEGKKFSDDGWVDHIWKGSSKNAISSLQNSSDDLLFFRAIQGRNGGEVIASELVGHVVFPVNWKEFIF